MHISSFVTFWLVFFPRFVETSGFPAPLEVEKEREVITNLLLRGAAGSTSHSTANIKIGDKEGEVNVIMELVEEARSATDTTEEDALSLVAPPSSALSEPSVLAKTTAHLSLDKEQTVVDVQQQHVQRRLTASNTFFFTGGVQEWVVPPGLANFTVDAYGAAGGNNVDDTYYGGLGGYISVSNISASPFVNKTLFVFVGAAGVYNTAPGLGGGGDHVDTFFGDFTSGGGATDLRTNISDLSSRLVVAGGGGGAAYFANGGAGGGSTAGTGGNGFIDYNWVGGGGGNQTTGGAGHTATWSTPYTSTSGTLGQGGNGIAQSGGGGGGYYGGGGGVRSGGGGGSSFANHFYTITTNYQGVQSGNGVLYITHTSCQAGYYLSSTCLACDSGMTSEAGASACYTPIVASSPPTVTPNHPPATTLGPTSRTHRPSSKNVRMIEHGTGHFVASQHSAHKCSGVVKSVTKTELGVCLYDHKMHSYYKFAVKVGTVNKAAISKILIRYKDKACTLFADNLRHSQLVEHYKNGCDRDTNIMYTYSA